MNLPFSTPEFVIGSVAAFGTWVVMRLLLRSRESSRLSAERAGAVGFIVPEAERLQSAERSAAELLAKLAPNAVATPATPSAVATAGITGQPRLAPISPKAEVAAKPPSPIPADVPAWKTSSVSANPSPWIGLQSEPSRGGSARWLGANEPVTISGIRIGGGLLYVGKSLRTREGREENCLINPDLPVASTLRGDMGLHYWPSYASISPTGRRAFLLWLADGRRDPAVDIGLVFLFFYGLERRLFVEGAISEAPVLVGEVERLLGIYGGNGSFQGYAHAFLAAARLASGDPAVPRPAPTGYSFELPLATRVHLGRLLAAGQLVDATAALLWVLGSPETRLRTPGMRCFDELEHLWAVRFAQRNPGGLKVRTPQRRIKVSYRMASGSVEVDIRGAHEALPDVAALTAPLQGLRDLLESCMTELEPFSRHLGRRPEARDEVDAIMLLPAAIRGTAANGVLAAARARLDALLGPTGMSLTTPRALAVALGIQAGQEVQGQQFVTRLSLMLDHLDVGLEPDRRYGGPPTGVDAKIVAFRASGGAPVAASHSAFDAARLALEIAVLAAAADGEVTPAELDSLVAEARKAPRLEAHERIRLEAFVRSLAGERPRIQAALKRAGSLPAEGRAAIASAAIGAVLADGQATADEVRFLERLHRTLQLPPESVHAALHQRSVTRDEPVSVAAEDLPPEIPLPAEDRPEAETPKARKLQIDQGRLARIRAETTSVSTLLANVFTDDEPAPTTPPPQGKSEGAEAGISPYDGLDELHGRLLAFVTARGGRASMDDFEAEARTLRLLPGAAMEVINDWGFANHEEVVLEEEGDEVVVPDHLLPSLAPN